jgi:hypothetical protein
METEPSKLYGVVSGDIVGSSKLDRQAREELYESMQRASSLLSDWLGGAMPLPVDIFGGDSWQVLLTSPEQSLAAALFYRAALRCDSPGVDTRTAVAIGTVDFVPGQTVSAGDGAAFRLSGRLLHEGLGKRRLAFAAEDAPSAGQWDLVFELLDALITANWTEKRARSVAGALRGWTQQAIGQLWEPAIDQATVNRHLKGAGWPAISRAVREFTAFWSSRGPAAQMG